MLTGSALAVGGVALGLYGATRFNFGTMISGWIIAGIGAVLFLSSFVSLP
jgi:hypothetical protein